METSTATWKPCSATTPTPDKYNLQRTKYNWFSSARVARQLYFVFFIPAMSVQSESMKERTRQFSFRVGHLVLSMGRETLLAEVYGKQLLRCASSVGANYRAACRAKSDRDFLHKLKICEEESDECLYWLEHIERFELVKPSRLEPLYQEAREICAIITSSAKTFRARLKD